MSFLHYSETFISVLNVSRPFLVWFSASVTLSGIVSKISLTYSPTKCNSQARLSVGSVILLITSSRLKRDSHFSHRRPIAGPEMSNAGNWGNAVAMFCFSENVSSNFEQ